MRTETNLRLFDPLSTGRTEAMTRTDRSFKPRIARTPPPSWWGRALYAVSTLWRRGDEKSLQALAALDDDEVENLSEYGQRLRVAARGAEERRRAGQWRQSPHA